MAETVSVPVSRYVVGEGKVAVVLPCKNPALAPLLDVTGFPADGPHHGGWLIRVSDAFGTVLWSVMIDGTESDKG